MSREVWNYRCDQCFAETPVYRDNHLCIWCDSGSQREPDDLVCLSNAEKKAQASRCGCLGSDDYCPCQNAPDRETRKARGTKGYTL